jgi:hypothetical protein
VADLRRIWIGKRQPFMAMHLERQVFIDETSFKTNMVKNTGWAPRGQRVVDHTPFGIAAPRCSSVACAIIGPMPLG